MIRRMVRSRGNSLELQENSLECKRAHEGLACSHAKRALPGSTATLRVEKAGTALMAAPPPRPGEQQYRTPRRRPEQVGEHMAHFGDGEREQRTCWRYSLSCRWLSGEHPSRSAA